MSNNKEKRYLSDLRNYFSELQFGFKLENLSYLPRWMVLLLDITMIFLGGFMTYFIFDGIKLKYIRYENLSISTPLYFFVNIFFFWIFRTYSGVIRHSSQVDALKLFFSQFFSIAVLISINYSAFIYWNNKFFLTTGLVINGIISFCFLFFYRIVVKYTFEHYFNNKNTDNLTKALIFGSDVNAIALANSLQSESPKRFKVIGFMDKSAQNTTKRIHNLPIFTGNVITVLRTMDADALIFADKSISKDERSQIIEDCLEYNFKVFTIPLLNDLEDQKEISKKIKNFEILDLLERKPIVLDNNSISKQLHNKTILVTGAAGSIGSEIVRQVILFKPKKIIVLDQAETPLHNLSLEISSLDPDVETINIISDIKNIDEVEQVFIKHKPEVVYHAAAYKHVPLMEENPAQAILNNVMGTRNLADLSAKYNVKNFVMVSTDKAVNPSNVMGASKRIAEKYVQSLDYKLKNENPKNCTKFITTRFGNVLGSNGSVVPLFTRQIQAGGPITITHPEIIRYFMTIPEACQLVLEAGAMGQGGEIYIFDMGQPVKIIDLAKKMIRLAGFTPDNEIKIKIIGLRPGEKLYEELLNDTSKTLPTHNTKIMISQDEFHHHDDLNSSINLLIETAKVKPNHTIVSKMKKIVPEYKSLNSVYEALDNVNVKN
ncbi:polysaccharide biosynthesis protein [Flavobacterium terrisoli]|uniref:polysaccharide biosynthesis protein n=1 Tax=Flavobacterium terrisoli TaxID=3242195 RepID=UPI002542E70A|nr:nucleoside-diphosphate sugar epimerase/dehydratase [Flavobacterium buctense]